MDALKQLNSIACWDYRIQSFDGSRLVIVGGTDLCYAHFVEAEFEDVCFISCPTEFTHAKFRRGTRAEARGIARLVAIDAGDKLFAIDAESSGSLEPQVYFIVAQRLRVSEGTVYHYERENLQPGERIADWVKQHRRT
jgi:hypothetical protein